MRVLLPLLFVSALAAQNGSQFKDWVPPNEPQSPPKRACSSLRSLTGYEFSVISAEPIAGDASAPDHCRVSGLILPEVRFEVNLPASWNKRLYMFGNGGFAGEAFDAPGRVQHRAAALKRGFAVASTDTGHDASVEPLASFAMNRAKLVDYAFRSLHVTAMTAKRIAQEYYAAAPNRSYFDGCSTGGRQGLILAQRFPADFDGIVVGAPVLNFTGTMMAYVPTIRALAQTMIPEAKLPALAKRIYDACDPLDGLKDGLIDDPRKCGFSPSRDLPKCTADADLNTCFTTRQIAALETIYGDVKSKGKTIFPGWPVGAEIAGPQGQSGWHNWILNDGGPTISKNFAESFFRYIAFPSKDASYDIARLNLDTDPQRLEAVHRLLDATDMDLSGFRSRGGKIVMYYGWADPALNPLMGVNYYEGVQQTMGNATGEFFRLFMVAGMFHCAGGVGASSFDAMTPLVKWVEHSTAPDRIIGTQAQRGETKRTRPLCPYPQVAKFKGQGSVDDAANFACARP